MDINEHIEKIIEGLIADITTKVTNQVDSVIAGAVSNKLMNYDFSIHIKEAAAEAFNKRAAEYQIDPKKLEARIAEKIAITIDQVQANTGSLISSAVESHISKTDFQSAMTNAVGLVVADKLKNYEFPTGSISVNSLNYTDNKLSGDAISGGIVQNFSSTGIDDRASNVALTILDEATVVENNLLTKDLTVEGMMTVNGDFVVNGNVPAESEFFKTLISNTSSTVINNLDAYLFTQYSNLIFDKISTEGINLSKINLNGKEIISDNTITSSISESNLQKVGVLRELQVEGESLLSQTLYVTNKRVGINTIEPSGALSIWDDEIEIIAMKKQKDTGSFGTPRAQRLVLTSNGKDNIILETDGSVSVKQLQIGSMKFSESSSPPNYSSNRGHVVWNNNPNIGGPLGWICLGEARWANFGIID
jgi:hypothetical protein